MGNTRPRSVISPVIATSWRTGMPESADTIAVVTEGRVTEEGTHDELIAAGGLYRDLYALQFREN